MNTKESIILHTIPILASEGYTGTSMRKVAGAMSREPSIIYAHFVDKESLLRETRQYINRALDESQLYSAGADASTLLRETIHFQFENREMIVALLQYFMASRQDFGQIDGGYVPARAYKHMESVIRQGIAEGVFHSKFIAFDAKASTHLVNGFLMEYFDRQMNNDILDVVVERLARYIERGLMHKVEAA